MNQRYQEVQNARRYLRAGQNHQEIMVSQYVLIFLNCLMIGLLLVR